MLLNGADRPTSGATLPIGSVPSGSPTVVPATATAASLRTVWSAIRLLMMRGCASKTVPVFWL